MIGMTTCRPLGVKSVGVELSFPRQANEQPRDEDFFSPPAGRLLINHYDLAYFCCHAWKRPGSCGLDFLLS